MKTALKMSGLILVLLIASCSIGGPSEPDSDQIKADLLGKRIGNPFLRNWTFASLSEFESFEIKDKKKNGNIVEYRIDTILKDSKATYSATLSIVYRLDENSWTMVNLSDNHTYKRISK